jgi:hypothetical protein
LVGELRRQMSISRLAGILVTVGLVVVTSSAHGAGPTAGGFASDNVEYVAHVPLNYDSPGARIVGKYLYLTTSRDLRIFDISDPVDPQLVGSLILPQTVYFAQEDVDTNGEILLIGGSVIDVEDKTNPRMIGSHSTFAHTISCVLNCTWAYGSEGQIVNLRNPSRPKLVPSKWGDGKPASDSHDVTEVAPGLVVTSSNPGMLLDARKNPAKPKLLALAPMPNEYRFVHSNLWPRKASDDFLLMGGETVGPTCNGDSAVFMTFDARRWRKHRSFKLLHEYRVANGLPTNGEAPANLFCTHWFDTHPDFRNGGLVTLAWYEHGTRFLDIDSRGRIKAVGWFVPFGGSTSAAYWATDQIVYAIDYNRGFDILRFKR